MTFSDPCEKLRLFEKAVLSSHGEGEKQFEALSILYGVLAEILPMLEAVEKNSIDPRITDAVDYIEKHYTERITIERLALEAKMSESRFFPCFKTALGVTPVDYLNHYRISKAIVMLVNHSERSVEEVSCAVGFESSTYFRRVFKNITGKNPRNYRKLNAEI